jgi:TolB protein
VTYSGGDFDYAAGVEKVSCEGPHDHEVFYVGEFEAPPGAPWPGEDAIADRVFGEVCIDEFSDSYGSWDDAFTIALWATYPLEEEWDGGLRTFKCSVASWPNDEDGTQLLGPAVSAGITLSGETLAFVAEFDGRDLHLYTYGHDGSVTETRNLTDDGNDGVEDTGIPSWSPDGSTVAFAAQDEDETWDIWVVDIATGEKTQLNDDAPVDSSTAISPDGTKILFTSRDRAQPERDIWVMDLDGENMTQLTDDPGVESTAHWSPDGSQIVYRSNANGSNDIWIMNADGSDQQMLIDNGGDEYDPRWSPNGDIAFISNVTGDFDIWLVGSDGQGAVNLTNHPGDDEYPSWTPDGEFIVFNSNRHGVTSLWMMRADGSDQSSLIGSFPTGWGAVRP